jgi:subtilisin-like proprotein convertase family protein
LAKLLDASATAPPVTTPPVTVPPVTSPPPAPSTPALRWDGGGPKVTSAVFRGATTTSFNTVRVTFDKKMNAPTFTPSDVVLTGPNGKITVTAVTAVANSNNSVFDITFATQATAGTYTVSIGPDVWDVQANRMDQNGNGISNEAGDRFATSATLGTSAPAPASPPATATRKTYASTATNVPILDSRTTRIEFGVTDTFSVNDLRVNLDLTHGRMTDLNIRLRSPDGKLVTLFNRRSLNLSGITFDDTAAASLSTSSLSAGAKVRPEEVLANFTGKAAKGTWTLEIFDLFAGQTGTVKSASLSFGTASAKAATSSFTQFASVDHSSVARPDLITATSKA